MRYPAHHRLHLPLTYGLRELIMHIQGLPSSEKFEMKHYFLETKEFSEAINIADELRGILREWDLCDTNISAITTDDGRNICSAVRELGWTNLLCFSHTIQLSS